MGSTLDFIVNLYQLNLNTRSLPIIVPGMSRGTLAQLFAELGFTKGVEIGVQRGKFTRKLGMLNPQATIYGIDPWLEYREVGVAGTQENQEAHYVAAQEAVPPNCILIRKKSMDAVGDFEDNSLDFVYIDGNHIFAYVANDLHEWIKKVKPDGIVSGHDYRPYYPGSHIHVFQVINAFTDAYRIRPWFTTDNSTENVKSWFWIKEPNWDHLVTL